jgi:arylsulfatase
MAVYAAQVHAIDRGVGQIIQCLEKYGRLENTLILFLSDNGGCAEILSDNWPRSLHVPYELSDGSPVFVGKRLDRLPGPKNTYASYGVGWANASNTPFTYFKHYIQEGGIGTPFIVSWPLGIDSQLSGSVIEQVGHIKDIAATLFDITGSEYPENFNGRPITPLEGISLKPNLSGKKVPVNPLFWEHHGNRGVRNGDWKLVSIKNGPWKLYDLASDRSEQADLASEKKTVKDKLILQYQEWATRVGVVKNPSSANNN